MEKTKINSVYLEDVHMKYLALMSVIMGLNKSQLIRLNRKYILDN
jgi:hypothetical protein